jgi:hypothetical protein
MSLQEANQVEALSGCACRAQAKSTSAEHSRQRPAVSSVSQCAGLRLSPGAVPFYA